MIVGTNYSPQIQNGSTNVNPKVVTQTNHLTAQVWHECLHGSILLHELFVKWIQCTVSPNARSAFSSAQRAWSELARCSGFCGQLGGWDTTASDKACILGLWQSAASYGQFMEGTHDSITETNEQDKTYLTSKVVLADSICGLQGTAKDAATAISQGTLLRVADCTVHAEQVEHFVAVQNEIWLSGMKQAGMLHGWFSRVPETNRFVVTSLWPSSAHHQAYLDGPFQKLRKEANAEADLASIKGAIVSLVPSWTVQPQNPAGRTCLWT